MEVLSDADVATLISVAQASMVKGVVEQESQTMGRGGGPARG
jgi:hypothetical protein